jgi:hypothetical protein
MKHPEQLINGEDPYKTGKDSSYMRYDAIEKLLYGQINGFREQAESDRRKGLIQLATKGENLVEKLEDAADIVMEMWRISKPHMIPKDTI